MWNLRGDLPNWDKLKENSIKHYEEFTKDVNSTLEPRISKTALILILVGLYFTVYYVIPWIKKVKSRMNLLTMILMLLLQIPILNILIKKALKKGQEKLYHELDSMLFNKRSNVIEVLPEVPLKPEVIRKRIEEMHGKQKKTYAVGKLSGTIYHSEDEKMNNSIEKSMEIFADSNAFEPDVFKGTAKLNADIINSTKKLFHADDETEGFTTFGGTESICAAIAAYKFLALKERGVTKPNLVFYKTAHAAFPKGCYYFDIEPRKIPCTSNGVSEPEKLYDYIDENTIAVVCSACSYAHGTIDDIATISEIARSYGVGCHVDNCLGGFVNCFADKFLEDMFPYDFKLPGVTSISADTHKYGYGPKGMSVCLLRPKKLFDSLRFTSVENSGFPMSMSNLGNYRSGAIIAGTWAAMMYNGMKVYVSKTKQIYDATIKLRKELTKIPEVEMYGPNNSVCMASFYIKGLDTIFVSLKLKEKKQWKLAECKDPAVCHLLVADSNLDKIDTFVEDLKEAIDEIKNKSTVKKSGYQTLYGINTTITDDSFTNELFDILLDGSFSTTKERAMESLNI